MHAHENLIYVSLVCFRKMGHVGDFYGIFIHTFMWNIVIFIT